MRHINYSIRITSTSCSHPREPAYQPLWSIKINRSEATTSTNEIFFTLVECAQLSVWLNWDLWLPQDSCWSFKKKICLQYRFFPSFRFCFLFNIFPPISSRDISWWCTWCDGFKVVDSVAPPIISVLVEGARKEHHGNEHGQEEGETLWRKARRREKKESRLNYIFPQLFCSVLLIGTAHTEERGWSENTEKMLELFNIRNKSSRALAHSSFDFDRKFYISTHGLRAGPKNNERTYYSVAGEKRSLLCVELVKHARNYYYCEKKSRINVFLVERGKEPDRERMGNAERPRQLCSKFIYTFSRWRLVLLSFERWMKLLFMMYLHILSLPLRKPSSVLGESEEESAVYTVKEQRDFKSFFSPTTEITSTSTRTERLTLPDDWRALSLRAFL